jgi:hypothetical protein
MRFFFRPPATLALMTTVPTGEFASPALPSTPFVKLFDNFTTLDVVALGSHLLKCMSCLLAVNIKTKDSIVKLIIK